MPKPKSRSDSESEPISFEQSLEELDTLVRRLEQGNLGLDQALADYEQAVKRLRICYGQLEAAERKVELLRGIRSDGTPETEPFDDETTSLEEKQQSRSRRRSSSSDLDSI